MRLRAGTRVGPKVGMRKGFRVWADGEGRGRLGPAHV